MKNIASLNEQLDLLKRGVEEIIPEDLLVKKIEKSIKNIDKKKNIWPEKNRFSQIDDQIVSNVCKTSYLCPERGNFRPAGQKHILFVNISH